MPKSFPAAELEHLLGVRPGRWERLESGGYGRVNAHWQVCLDDGRSVFVKQALTPDAGVWLRSEQLVYEHVGGVFMPAYFGTYDTDDCVMLVLEDLSAAEWPPPWSRERIDSVLASLAAVRDSPPPAGLGMLEELREVIAGWPLVRDNPEPLLSAGVCSRDWLEQALPALLRAASDAELGGASLLHLDVRSDNLCFKGGAAVLVDWNQACVGNALFDIAFWLPSLRLEGGPQPWEVLAEAGQPPSPASSLRALGCLRLRAPRPCVSSSCASSRSRCPGPRVSLGCLRRAKEDVRGPDGNRLQLAQELSK